MRVTADMLPKEGGDVIKFFFAAQYPDGATVEELKSSDHRVFRDIGKYFEKEASANGHNVL